MNIISIHIPKTAGTSFYHILSQVYGDRLSLSLKRRDIKELKQGGKWGTSPSPTSYDVLHGHFRYDEIIGRITAETKLICWLRDPLQRLISNYHFFKMLCVTPQRNPANYARRKHRANEALETYAARPGNQNRICEFIGETNLHHFDFVGQVETFTKDIQRLSKLLSWPEVYIPYHNRSNHTALPIAPDQIEQLIHWNLKDVKLYCTYLTQIDKPIPKIYESFL
ncbi:MAG: sulfotransferase family 2 domain-containing protein [Bacteroidota bacterium]